VNQKEIKERVLKEMDSQDFDKKRTLRKTAKPPAARGVTKTPLMMYIEILSGKPIESMLLSGSLSVVSKKLTKISGRNIDPSTVSKWIKRFRLRYTADNLPDCGVCNQRQAQCDSGICGVLADQQLYKLVPLKQEQVLTKATECDIK